MKYLLRKKRGLIALTILLINGLLFGSLNTALSAWGDACRCAGMKMNSPQQTDAYLSSPGNCCCSMMASSCHYKDNGIPENIEYVVIPVRSDRNPHFTAFLASVDDDHFRIDQPVYRPPTSIQSKPESVPIYLKNLSIIC